MGARINMMKCRSRSLAYVITYEESAFQSVALILAIFCGMEVRI